MSELPDDKTLDEYLQRKSTVSQHYRNLDSDDVPPALDSSVLGQAREALAASKANKKPAWTRWSAPVALAASLVLGVAVVLDVGVEEKLVLPAPQVQQAREAVSTDAASVEAIEQVTKQPLADTAAPIIAPKVDAPASASPTSRRQLKASESKAGAQKREASVATKVVQERDAVLSREEPRAPPPPAAAPSPNALEEQGVLTGLPAREAADKPELEARRDQSVAANAEFSRTRAQATVATSAMRPASAPAYDVPQEAQPPRLEPVLWLEQIRTLRREGKVLEADEQWRQFSEAYPNFDVAADDLARSRR
jgi:hypothetical protein